MSAPMTDHISRILAVVLIAAARVAAAGSHRRRAHAASRRLGRLAIACLLAVSLSACAGSRPQGDAAAADTLTGAIAGTDLFVALVTDLEQPASDRQLTAYVCDGAVAEWFNGTVSGDDADLRSAGGARLQVRLASAGATGTLTLPGGASHPVELAPATGQAGLYRGEEQVGGVDYVGGWIVLDDGSQRGAVKAGGAETTSSSLSFATATAPLPQGAGALTAFRITKVGLTPIPIP